MRLLKALAASSTLFLSVSAVGIEVCYFSGFTDCKTITGASGQCLFVSGPYNDHVFSARAASGTRRCDSYNHVNNGACGSVLVQGIDQAGYSGLPSGHLTSGFVCYN
ncbi:hypothetical protein QBC40DRAFT_249821 [Triangularia verruculosa]|uniref:Uncharacterized protein n=1 Tax=Triangularia verruculosa TaxID=2587418 RepID=A0AAN6XQ29_9PEZI|nr:hypothetical protein QBC40DRAFT_249821 [Triangularia verruculosa]